MLLRPVLWQNYLLLKLVLKLLVNQSNSWGLWFHKRLSGRKILQRFKTLTIGEGTSEIQKIVIARKILNNN